MNQQDQQAIDELFQYLYTSTAQSGPRDPEAEARIQQHFQQGPPGLLYHMAQTLVAQHHALQQTRAQLAAYQQPSGAPAGFAPPGAGQPGSAGYGPPPPPYQQPPVTYQQASPPPAGPQPGHHGFLAGAGKLALGIGGGILGADALRGIFGGGGGFGGDGGDYGDRDDSQNDGGQDDYGGQDPGDGGFGDDQGGW